MCGWATVSCRANAVPPEGLNVSKRAGKFHAADLVRAVCEAGRIPAARMNTFNGVYPQRCHSQADREPRLAVWPYLNL